MTKLFSQLKIFLIFLLTTLFSLPIFANYCRLGDSCNLQGSGLVIYKTTLSDGNSYVCTLQSNNHRYIHAMFLPGQDFQFAGKEVSANDKPNYVLIEGKFAQPNGKGSINIKNVSTVTGKVTCEKNK